MNQMMGSTPSSDEARLLNDAVVCQEISYLDSSTNYREFLRAQARARKQQLKSKLTRAKTVKCLTCAGVLFVVILLLVLSWFFG